MNCYVLTGGQSRRMGQSKAALFFDRVAAAARPVFDDVIALDWMPGEKAPIFGVARALRDVRQQSLGSSGPRSLGGISQSEEPSNRGTEERIINCFILAVDYPLITSEVLRFLRERGGVPMWNGEPQLLCAVWDASLLPQIDARIAAGRLDLRGLNETEIIAEAELRQRFEGEPLANVNTPADLAAAERGHGS